MSNLWLLYVTSLLALRNVIGEVCYVDTGPIGNKCQCTSAPPRLPEKPPFCLQPATPNASAEPHTSIGTSQSISTTTTVLPTIRDVTTKKPSTDRLSTLQHTTTDPTAAVSSTTTTVLPTIRDVTTKKPSTDRLSTLQHTTTDPTAAVSSTTDKTTTNPTPERGTTPHHSTPITDMPNITAVCDSTSMTVYLDRGLLSNRTDAGDVHFRNEDCVGIDHDSTQIVLYTRYDMCSTRIEETEKSIIYSNIVTYYTPQPITDTEITREYILKIPVRCELDRQVLLSDSFVPKTGEIWFNETGYGDFSLQLNRYTDMAFDQLVGDDEGVVTLGEHLYFAVNLTSVTGLTVFIENGWATPSQYPNDDKRYNFLQNGCSEDPTMEKIYSPDPSFSQFVIDAFTFIEESPQVFVHCEVLVCNHDDPSSRCIQGCQTRLRRDSRYTRGTSSIPHLISNGPLSTPYIMGSAHADQNGGSPGVSLESGILIGALAGVTCLVVTMAAILLYMIRSGRTSHHGYRRLNFSDDFE